MSLLWYTSLPFIGFISIVFANLLILYIYLTFIISPHTRTHHFRPLLISHKQVWPELQKLRSLDTDPSRLQPIDPVLDPCFDTLLHLVIRDFITSWFRSDQAFPISVNHVLRSACSELVARCQKLDWVSFFVNKIIPIVTLHMSEFRKAEVSLRGRFLERAVTQTEELDLLLVSQLKKVHPAVSAATTEVSEVVYLRQLVDRVLPFIIEKNELKCGPVRVVVREIVVNSVLCPVVGMVSDPDFWNQTMETYLGQAIIEQKMVRQLREVLNRHSTNEMEEVMSLFDDSPSLKKERDDYFSTDPFGKKSFQDFLKMIQEEQNVLDLKRVRNDIVTQIRKKKALIADRDPEEVMDGERVSDIMIYINRLMVAKKRADKKIGTLSGEHLDIRSRLFSSGHRKQSMSQHGVKYNLQDILTNPSGLSYFMEFMDRRGDMVKLQFWLIVEGFHRTDNSDDDTFLSDVKMLYEMYFTEHSPHRLNIDKFDLKEGIESFNMDDLRKRLYQIQQHVFWELEKDHFPYFKRSDLYFKFLASNLSEDVPSKRSDSEDEFELPVPRLVRSNTVDAVEAELRSILDGKRPAVSSSLLLCGKTKKSSTALPVQNTDALPLWTSSGGSTSELEHHVLPSDIHLAPPGDLMLENKVGQLADEIDRLTGQEAIVDALIQKAETQQKLEELRILKKSKSMFRQEIQQIKYQKSQYELQESENVLMPDRSQVSITSATIGSDKQGEFALYVIEIHQLGPDGHYVSGWIVARRYSEFYALHQKLKDTYTLVKNIEFPSKWPLLKLQKPFLDSRRISLQKYLRALIEDPEICKSSEFRTFLSQQKRYEPDGVKSSSSSIQSSPSLQNLQKVSDGFMKNLYKTVAAGIDDILVGPSMLDLITQRLSEQVIEFSQEGELQLKSDTKLTEPLCDLFIEMFELKDKTNWLRRQAVVVILQQILEGTIERKLKEVYKYLTSSTMIVSYFDKITQSIWPDGGPMKLKEPRKLEEKIQTREEANRKLSTWLPDLLGNMVGRQNARKGARRLFTVLQNKRLNQHLLYTLLDELIYALFPELNKEIPLPT
ncbi:PXA domain-containing protein [Pilobolus umbonatus]|nr:PXA domain-containing protein [Pilobolus umbonatus]